MTSPDIRREVAVNEALLAYVEAHGHSPGCDVSMFVGRERCNCGYTELAFALRASLLALAPASAPVTEAGRYEPKVGDIVTISSVSPARYHGWWLGAVGVVEVQRPGIFLTSHRIVVKHAPNYKGNRDMIDEVPLYPEHVRLATDDEERAAGLDAAPVTPPPATRPTWVRVTGPKGCEPDVTIGKVYEVVEWSSGGWPIVINDEGKRWGLSVDARDAGVAFPSWEPAPAPVEPAKGRLAECVSSLLDVMGPVLHLEPTDSLLREKVRTVRAALDGSAS